MIIIVGADVLVPDMSITKHSTGKIIHGFFRFSLTINDGQKALIDQEGP